MRLEEAVKVMNAKVAVLCWEASRPWVSALRQNGYSVPWVEEPKGDAYRQIPGLGADVVLVDLTRQAERTREMVIDLAGREELKEVPIVVVSEKQGTLQGLRAEPEKLILAKPSGIIAAIKSALSAKD
jgi:CheY-like chemotaxis protein